MIGVSINSAVAGQSPAGEYTCCSIVRLSGYRECQKKCRPFAIDQKENRVSLFILAYFTVKGRYAFNRYLVDLEDDISAP